jgi:hypothetical protein
MFAKALFVAAAVVVGTTAAEAQTSSVTGSGTFGTQAASYICPPIAIFSHGLITFRLNVTSKGDAPGEATGVFQARCGGFNSTLDTVPITAIIEMTETRAWVRGAYDLARAGYNDCVDRAGNAKSRIDLDIQVQAGTTGSLPEPTIHASSVVPAGGISCTDPTSPTSDAVVFQNFDGGVRPLLTGNITVTAYRRSGRDQWRSRALVSRFSRARGFLDVLSFWCGLAT